MVYKIDLLNSICTDNLGGTGGHVQNITALNEWCVLAGGTGGHRFDISAYNELSTLYGGTGGYKYDIDALNEICVLSGGTGGHRFAVDALVELGALLNQFEAETIALFDRMLVKPDLNTKIVINKMLKSLKDEGIFQKMDCFYNMAAHNEQAATLNWIKDAHNLLPIDSPAFTPNRGFKCNGTTQYLRTQYNPTVDGINYKLNDGSIGIFVRETINGSGADIGCRTGSTTARTFINSNAGSPAINQFYLHTSNTLAGNYNADMTLGLFAVSRSESGNAKVYKNKRYQTSLQVTDSMPNTEMTIGALNSNGTIMFFANRQYSFAYIGASLSESELNSLWDIIRDYRQAMNDSVLIDYVSPLVQGIQGYTTDGEYHYTFEATGIYKRNNDVNWSILTQNLTPLNGLNPALSHIGDGSYYDGKLYISIDSGTNNSHAGIRIYDANTLLPLSFIDVYNEMAEISGLIVVPEDNTIYAVTYYGNHDKIYKYNLETGEYIGFITLTSPIAGKQGIAYKDNYFYITSHLSAPDEEKIYKVAKDGSTSTAIITESNKIELEGIDYSQNNLRYQVYIGTSAYVMFKHI